MAVSLPDARELSDDILEALRLRALHGCELGFTQAEIADLLGVRRETVCTGGPPMLTAVWTPCPTIAAGGPRVRAVLSRTNRLPTSNNNYAHINPRSWASPHLCGPAALSAS
jgi:hypothetical protein